MHLCAVYDKEGRDPGNLSFCSLASDLHLLHHHWLLERILAVTPALVPRNTQKHEPVLVPLAYTSSQVQSNLRQSLTNKELIFRRQLLVTQLISATWPPALLLCSLRRRSCCSGCKGCPRQRVCDCLGYRNNVSACCGPSISFSTGPRIVIKSNPSLLLFDRL